MKITITTIVFVAILYVLPINAHETQMYLPIFSDTDTTRFCFFTPQSCSDCFREDYVFRVGFAKDPNSERTYNLVDINSTFPHNIFFNKFIVSEDNSKLWGSFISLNDEEAEIYKFLLMDLDLNIGDTFDYPLAPYYQSTVVDVYQHDGRKHIKFDQDIGLFVWGDSLTFIEGVGSNLDLSTGRLRYLVAKYINHSLEYCVPYVDTYVDCDCVSEYGDVSFESLVTGDTIGLYPAPVNVELNLQIPESVDIKDAQINIYDMQGNVHIYTKSIETGYKLDVSNLAPGIYVLQIIGSHINQSIKFIKL